MTFEQLRPSDWVVFVAALALLFTTAPDWYSTTRGEEARQIQDQAGQSDAQEGRDVESTAAAVAEAQERNAWQEDALIDRIILIALLATSALRAAGMPAIWLLEDVEAASAAESGRTAATRAGGQHATG